MAIIAAIMAILAAVAFGVGYLAGTAMRLALWLWLAFLEGYKAAL